MQGEKCKKRQTEANPTLRVPRNTRTIKTLWFKEDFRGLIHLMIILIMSSADENTKCCNMITIVDLLERTANAWTAMDWYDSISTSHGKYEPKVNHIYEKYMYLIECSLECYCFLRLFHTPYTKLVHNPFSSTFRSLDDLTRALEYWWVQRVHFICAK